MAHPSWSRSSSPEPAGQRSTVILPERTPKVPPSAYPSDLDPSGSIAALQAALTAGDLDFSAALHQIVETAQAMTGASGAAIAMRHEGAVFCLARVGETAPDLGSKLDEDSGISGECLRSGKALRCGDTHKDVRVDAEACRRLHLRSLAVVPLHTEKGVIGILEAFSDLPYSFPDRHLQLLQSLAGLVVTVRLRAAETEHDDLRAKLAVGEAAEPRPSRVEQAKQALAPLLKKSKDWLAALSAREMGPLASQHFSGRRVFAVLAAVGVLGTAFWVFRSWRSSPPPEARRVVADNPTAPSPALPASSAPSVNSPLSLVFHGTAKGGANSIPKPSPASAKVSQKTEKMDVAEDLVQRLPETNAASGQILTPPQDQQVQPSKPSPPAEAPSPAEDAPVLAGVLATSPGPLGDVLTASPALPAASLTISQGISQGVVLHRVQPVYPAQARTLRLEGTVVLQGTVTESGTVSDVKVVSGHPVLARAAVNAVTQWRYRPYALNGKPIAMQTNITIDFKLP